MSALPLLKLTLQSHDAILLIMNDLVAKHVAVAWKIYRPSFKDSPLKTGEDEYDAIARLWEGVGPIDFDRLAQIAGVPVTRVTKAFARLKAANLIWPDGTMSDEARKIIVGEINLHLMPMIPKSPPKDKGKTNDGKPQSTDDKKPDRKSSRVKTRLQTGRDQAGAVEEALREELKSGEVHDQGETPVV